MATAHSMLANREQAPRPRRTPALLLALCLGALPGACMSGRLGLQHPTTLSSPYAEPDVVWAVAPLANESGVSIVDELAVTDDLADTITQVQGLSALPVNRTLAAMRALGMPGVRSPDDARALAKALGADAIVVGSITAWYPYEPPRLGMNLAVYSRTKAMDVATIDPVKLSQATTDSQIAPGPAPALPVASVARFFDASNHAVIADIRGYAVGRTDTRSAMGDEIYTKSMERYTQFVCFRMVGLLLDQERTRLTVADATQ